MKSKLIKERIKSIIYHQLPISAVQPSPLKESGNIYLTIALKRSGQHAVINWLCHQLNSTIHLNHCIFLRQVSLMMAAPCAGRFVTYNNGKKVDSGWTTSKHDKKPLSNFFVQLEEAGLYKNILYSFEEIPLDDPLLQKFIYRYNPKIILILRDTYNCLASSFQHHGQKNSLEELEEKKSKLTTYLKQSLGVEDYLKSPVISIDFGAWLKNEEYRKQVMEQLGLPFSEVAEKAIEEVQTFGGGSSFEGTEAKHDILRQRVFERWKCYENNADYQQLLNDQVLEKLTWQFFKIKKPF